MNKKEYGAWPAFSEMGDDPRYSVDEYNRSFIKERFDVPDGYASKNVDEYYQVPKMQDAFENLSKKKTDNTKSDKSRQQQKTRQLRQNMIRQVVAMAAGSVVIVSSYQAMAQEQQQQPLPDTPAVVQPDTPSKPTENEPVILSPEWKWSEDKQTVVLELLDASGALIKSIPAEISVLEEAATCTGEGLKTYTATAEYEENKYSDTQSEVLPPLGHTFGEGKETVENGQTVTKFECTRCHEEFTVTTSVTEND